MSKAAQQERFNHRHGSANNISPTDIGASSWGDFPAVEKWQTGKIDPRTGKELIADGWFGTKSVQAFKALHQGASSSDQIPIFGEFYSVPGAKVVYRPGVLASRGRRESWTTHTILVHQSVTYTRKATERVLQKKGLGVCSLVDPYGVLFVYGDIGHRYTAHGNERNRTSVGLELINPYTRLRDPWTVMVEPSRTAWKGREVQETDVQIETAAAWIRFLTSQTFYGPGDRKLEIPLEFPTQTSDTQPVRGDSKKLEGGWFDKEQGGIIAHGHRPGRYPPGHNKAGKRVKGAHADARRSLLLLKQKLQGDLV